MTQSAYDCKKPNIEVADILREHIPDYLAKYRMPPEHYKVVYDILNCRTAYLGGHIEECDHCGTKRNAYNSCSNRHCPKCQTITKEKWLEARKAELLPVPYFHSVFTLPHDLNPVILCNKKVMLRILFKAVSINKRTPKDFSHSIPPSLLFKRIIARRLSCACETQQNMVVAPMLFSQSFCNFVQLLMLGFVPQAANLLGLTSIRKVLPQKT